MFDAINEALRADPTPRQLGLWAVVVSASLLIAIFQLWSLTRIVSLLAKELTRLNRAVRANDSDGEEWKND